MKTLYGPEAKDGDYVIVTNVYGCPMAYPAKVHQGKAYTGQMIGSTPGKYLHRTEAVSVIPESHVSEQRKKLIAKDIALATEKHRK